MGRSEAGRPHSGEPPYGSTERALKEADALSRSLPHGRTTIRLYRESTERTQRWLRRRCWRRTTIRLYRESTERGHDHPGQRLGQRRTTIRLYRESTESGRGELPIYTILSEPPYGSTERALKDSSLMRDLYTAPPGTTIRLYRESTESPADSDAVPVQSCEPPYGSTERALKGSLSSSTSKACGRTTIRLYRESTERFAIEQYVKGLWTNHHTALQREH